MGLASKVDVVVVNKYSKFEWCVFDSVEVIQLQKNFNLVCNADANADANANANADADAQVTV